MPRLTTKEASKLQRAEHENWCKTYALVEDVVRRKFEITRPCTTRDLTASELAGLRWLTERFDIAPETLRVSNKSEGYNFSVPEILASLSEGDRISLREGRTLPEPMITAATARIRAIVKDYLRSCNRRERFQNWPDNELLQKTSTSGLAASLGPTNQPFTQFGVLKVAGLRNSRKDIENVWLNLSPEARDIFDRALLKARENLPVLPDEYRCGDMRKSWVPTTATLLKVIPIAEAMTPKTGRPPVTGPRRAALAGVLDVFNTVTAPMASARRKRGRYALLFKEGIPFIQAIETIFGLQGTGVHFLTADEEGEVEEARKRMGSFIEPEDELTENFCCYKNITVFPPLN